MADDLTGALDTAAEFVPLTGPVRTFWQTGNIPPQHANAAFDTGTREWTAEAARRAVTALAPALAGADIAYKKVDSLLRGPTVAELATCFSAGDWHYGVFAPAFPYHGRVTREGRQHTRLADGNWEAVSGHLVAALQAEGVAAQVAEPGAALRPGITLFDAETDADMAVAVAAGMAAPAPVLWCGSGGLAHALATRHAGPAPAMPPLRGRVLGLFGSDQAITAAQLAACDPHWLELPDGGAAAQVADRLSRTGVALVSFALPPGLARDAAAARIGAEMERLVADMDPPGSLIVAGGETLRSLCVSLGATSLDVQGRYVPGLPRSILRGGRWDGVDVISKSGAFGHPGLLRDLLQVPGEALVSERIV
jgi:uncharacterized protein YgbK (DUF1537 family)